METNPYEIAIDFDAESTDHVIRFSVREGPPLRLGTIVGDVVHNVRSSLDQAVWLLARQTTPLEELWKPRIRNKIHFPILRHRNEFVGHSVMPFLTEPAKVILDGFQPYKRDKPKLHPLALLNELWNTDKHRVVLAGYAGFDLAPLSIVHKSVHIEALKDVTTEWLHPQEAQDGTEIARIRFGGGYGPPEAQIEMQGQPTVEILFGAGELAFRVGTLASMVEYAAMTFPFFSEVLDPQR